jgi:hypothetical protein
MDVFLRELDAAMEVMEEYEDQPTATNDTD